MKKITFFALLLFSHFFSLLGVQGDTPQPEDTLTYTGPTQGYDPTDSYFDEWAISSYPLGVDPEGYSYAIPFSPVTAGQYAYCLTCTIARHELYVAEMASGGNLFNLPDVPIGPITQNGTNYSVPEAKQNIPITFMDFLRPVRYVNWYNWYLAYKEDYKKENPSYREGDPVEEEKFKTQVRKKYLELDSASQGPTEHGTYLIHNEYRVDAFGVRRKIEDSDYIYITPDREGIRAAILKDQEERKVNPAKPPLKMAFLIPKSILLGMRIQSLEDSNQIFYGFFNITAQPGAPSATLNCFVPVKQDKIEKESGEDFKSFEKRKRSILPTYSSYLFEWTSTFVGEKSWGNTYFSGVIPADATHHGKYYQVGGVFGDKASNSSARTVLSQRWEGHVSIVNLTAQLKNSGFRIMEVTFPPNADPNKLPAPVEYPEREDPDNPGEEYHIAPIPPSTTEEGKSSSSDQTPPASTAPAEPSVSV